MKRDVTNIYYYINKTSDQYHSYIPGMWFFREIKDFFFTFNKKLA